MRIEDLENLREILDDVLSEIEDENELVVGGYSIQYQNLCDAYEITNNLIDDFEEFRYHVAEMLQELGDV